MTSDTTLLSSGGKITDTGGAQKADATTTEVAAVADTTKTEASTPKPEGDTKATTQTDVKTDAAGDKGKADGAGDGKTEADKAATGAPEKYEAFKVGEGIALDAPINNAFSEVARELNLPQAQAQKVIDKMGPAIQAHQLEVLKQQEGRWSEATMKDKEIGGVALEENLGIAKSAMEKFASPALTKVLGNYNAKDNPTGLGLGNHPEVIRMFLQLGKAIGEDNRIVPGDSTGLNAVSDASAASKLYPDQNKQKA